MKYLAYGIAATALFTIFVTVFAASADKNSVRVLPKIAWVALCLFVPIVGGLLYLIIGRPVSDASSSPTSNRAKRTLAPDDDPQFLRDLERRLREQKMREDKNKEDLGGEPKNESDTDPDSNPGNEPKP